jgi:hypothetical protein
VDSIVVIDSLRLKNCSRNRAPNAYANDLPLFAPKTCQAGRRKCREGVANRTRASLGAQNFDGPKLTGNAARLYAQASQNLLTPLIFGITNCDLKKGEPMGDEMPPASSKDEPNARVVSVGMNTKIRFLAQRITMGAIYVVWRENPLSHFRPIYHSDVRLRGGQ